MKKQIIYFCFGLSLLIGCNIKRERIEEGAYNPYDTSEETETNEVKGDTIYATDSAASNLQLHEPGKKQLKN